MLKLIRTGPVCRLSPGHCDKWAWLVAISNGISVGVFSLNSEIRISITYERINKPASYGVTICWAWRTDVPCMAPVSKSAQSKRLRYSCVAKQWLLTGRCLEWNRHRPPGKYSVRNVSCGRILNIWNVSTTWAPKHKNCIYRQASVRQHRKDLYIWREPLKKWREHDQNVALCQSD